MKTVMTAALLALAFPLASRAQEAPAAWTETRFHRIHLRNGNFIDGHLVRKTQTSLVLHLGPPGEFSVRRDLIDRLEFLRIRSFRELPVIDEAKGDQVVEKPTLATAKAPAPKALEGRYPAELRAAIDRLLATHAATLPQFRRDLAPGIRATGTDGIAYACLVARLQKKDVDHPALLGALGRIEDVEVTPTLVEVLRSSADADLRTAAIQALLRQNTPAAVEALHRAVDDPCMPVRQAAVAAVLRLAEKGQEKEEILIDQLRVSQDKHAVALVLGKLGGEAGLDALHILLREGETDEKIAALQGLREGGRSEDVGYVTSLLDQADPFLRTEAGLFLGHLKHGPAVPDLIAALGDEDDSFVGAVLWSLRRITGEAFGADPEVWTTWWDRAGRRAFAGPSGN